MNIPGSSFNNCDMHDSREKLIKEYIDRDYKVYVFDTPRDLYQWMAQYRLS